MVSSIGVTDEGQLMNVNADQAATALAATLGADLILLSDVSGILDGKGQRIAEMTAAKAEQLIEQGIITDGMIVKVNAALDAARTLGRPVDIASRRHAEQLPALFNGMPMGTRIFSLSFCWPEAQLSGIEFQNKETELWHFGGGRFTRGSRSTVQTIQRLTAL